MSSADPISFHVPTVPPLARALADAWQDGLVLLDASGRFLYANNAAREVLGARVPAQEQLSRLAVRRTPLRVGGQELGEAVLLGTNGNPTTLAERERRAIIETLEANGGKLAETARRLGISRTTLWRRLKAYGIR